jgi:hypothetical protein
MTDNTDRRATDSEIAAARAWTEQATADWTDTADSTTAKEEEYTRALAIIKFVSDRDDEVRRLRAAVNQLIGFRNLMVAERGELADRVKAVREFAEKYAGGVLEASHVLRTLGDPHPAESRPAVDLTAEAVNG